MARRNRLGAVLALGVAALALGFGPGEPISHP
jgi:hypothetical protein